MRQRRRQGFGASGICIDGLVDLALLASTLITPDARLWTLDPRLQTLAERFKVRYHPRQH